MELISSSRPRPFGRARPARAPPRGGVGGHEQRTPTRVHAARCVAAKRDGVCGPKLERSSPNETQKGSQAVAAHRGSSCRRQPCPALGPSSRQEERSPQRFDSGHGAQVLGDRGRQDDAARSLGRVTGFSRRSACTKGARMRSDDFNSTVASNANSMHREVRADSSVRWRVRTDCGRSDPTLA